MERTGSQFRLAATDLAHHLACRHLTTLDRAAAAGEREAPFRRRPEAEVLAERGRRHEQEYLRHLSAAGRRLVTLDRADTGASARERTRAAMQSGADVIVQAALGSGRWVGRADLLVRVEQPSALGSWSYEVQDAKLTRETRGGTILQLCLYSDLVAEIQGRLPEFMHVIVPGVGFVPESYRVADFMAYYRQVRGRLETVVDDPEGGGPTYPEPVPHCDVCRWWTVCDRQRRTDDHLSLVARLSKLQARELRSRQIDRLATLAEHPLPLAWRPRRGAVEGYVRVREQARVQLEGRRRKLTVHEWLPDQPGRGLRALPEPSVGDVFLDLEGDAYVEGGGREYLFGIAALDASGAPAYECRWGTDPEGEKAGFEWLIDAIGARLNRHPDLHVYHFGVYEPGALKRLMGRHATRETEIDDLLRAGRFIDLHAVTAQALRASVEGYSLKELEAVFGYARELPLDQARASLRTVEHALELGHLDLITPHAMKEVESYNRDDCQSTWALRDWLERRRAEREAAGDPVPRPAPPESAGKPETKERERVARELAARLTADVPADPALRTSEQRARVLLAHLLEWHRREEKAPWWDYFRLRDLSSEDLHDERSGIGGMAFVARVGGTAKCPVDRYTFPRQETRIRAEDVVHAGDVELGEVVRIDPVEGWVEIKKRQKCADLHPDAVFEHRVVETVALSQSLLRLGRWIAEHGLDAAGPYRAARDLLLGRPPRLAPPRGEVSAPPELDLWTPVQGEKSLARAGESGVEAARRLGPRLDGGTLAIQGPPGSGKTFTGAQMICDLVRSGRRVGVTAVSHKVVRNLLDAAAEEAARRGLGLRSLHKVGRLSDPEPGHLRETTDNEDVVKALQAGEIDVVGGTAWLWSREDLFESVDVLFVDEAGQMWLADVLALAQGGHNVVLLGDPQQLEQPQQGSHPDGAAVTALEHVLEGHKTITAGRGLFLAETWRLHPEIARFTSELFYEGRLGAHAGLERQRVSGSGSFDGAGLWFVPVPHQGNQSAATEEVEVVAGLVQALTSDGVTWVDGKGRSGPLGLEDILVVAPYNAQVADLTGRLPRGARVGTVDRFQGQEAAVVIVSLTTSSHEDAPRGMEFLYSTSRLNVATSRARCACILVGSPRLFEPECQTPNQMRLANAFCRFLELAGRVEPERATIGHESRA